MLMTRRVLLAAAGVSSVWWMCSRSRAGGRVEVNFRVIRYWESDDFIQLAWEPIIGKRPVAYVPSLRRWREEMPEWARDRRDEIFPEIKHQTQYMDFIWEEYD
jgi:hypothetical protein